MLDRRQSAWLLVVAVWDSCQEIFGTGEMKAFVYLFVYQSLPPSLYTYIYYTAYTAIQRLFNLNIGPPCLGTSAANAGKLLGPVTKVEHCLDLAGFVSLGCHARFLGLCKQRFGW